MRSTASHGLSGPTQCRGITSYFRDRRSFRIWTDVEVSSVTPITAPPSSEKGRSEKRRTPRAGPEVAMPEGRGATATSGLRESTSERGPASSVPAAMARPSARGFSGTRSTPRRWAKNGSQLRYGMRPTLSMASARQLVPDLDDVVQGVPLDGDLSRIPDHPENLLAHEARPALRPGGAG